MRSGKGIAGILLVALLFAGCVAPAEPPLAPAVATEAAAPAAATGETAAPTGNAVKVATVGPLSGPQSVYGASSRNGAQLALEQAQDRLAAAGVIVELTPFDDQATPDVGVANAQQIVADPAVMCVIGHLNSGVMIPASEVYHNAGLVAITASATNPLITDRGYAEINRLVGRDDVQGVVAAEFAAADLSAQSIYVIHDKTAYGQGIAEFVRQHAEALGVAVVGFEGTEEQANFDSVITPILGLNPDLVFFAGLYPQAGLFFRQARDKGVTAQFMGPDGMDTSELASIAGDAVTGMHYTASAGPAMLYPGAAQFITDYTARFNEEVQPFSAQSYDAMGICLQAIIDSAQAAGGAPERSDVAARVRATADYPGITGAKSFNSQGDLTVAQYFVIQVNATGAETWGDNAIVKTLEIPAPVE